MVNFEFIYMGVGLEIGLLGGGEVCENYINGHCKMGYMVGHDV